MMTNEERAREAAEEALKLMLGPWRDEFECEDIAPIILTALNAATAELEAKYQWKLETALRQWRMYAEFSADRDVLSREDSVEGHLYRECASAFAKKGSPS